ncbi:hypothetical protein [Adhaeribacter aquaticus]|uniref:hypothetical protein n=1 Tax=Adhaeribacter aquaticus TaxID=299567 RepID=UPI00047BD047|nr:hypothetical protein [Adhaeribacter aquaticus]
MQTLFFSPPNFSSQKHQAQYDAHTLAIITRLRSLECWVRSLMIADAYTADDIQLASRKAKAYNYQLHYRKKRLAIANKKIILFIPFSLN